MQPDWADEKATALLCQPGPALRRFTEDGDPTLLKEVATALREAHEAGRREEREKTLMWHEGQAAMMKRLVRQFEKQGFAGLANKARLEAEFHAGSALGLRLINNSLDEKAVNELCALAEEGRE